MKPVLMLTLATIASVASSGFIAAPNAAESVGGEARGVGTPSSSFPSAPVASR